MTALLCCRRRPPTDMGAALSQEGSPCELAGAPQPPTMADVIRERKKKAGGAALGTLRRRIVAAARRPRDSRPDRGCEHARFIRSVVSSWRLADVQVLHAELEATAALRDLSTQAGLARPPATTLPTDLRAAFTHRWWCDVELIGSGWSIPAHRAILAARSTYFRHLLPRYPNSRRVPLEGLPGVCASGGRKAFLEALHVIYEGTVQHCSNCKQWERGADADLDIINVENSHASTWTVSRSDSWRARRCACADQGQGQGQSSRRLLDHLGTTSSPTRLQHDMKYLLDSGEYADACLSFRGEGGDGQREVEGGTGGQGGSMQLACHRVVLAARSTLFRKVLQFSLPDGSSPALSSNNKTPRVITVDEQVLPRRFAVALLHCAYTDQVDLSLIQRAPSSPTSASSSSSNTSWSMGRGTNATGTGASRGQCAQLEDAFQLYEIARFLEMPILSQGCEDACAALLSPATLPRVLRWSVAPHASAWLHRQAMRYLLDEWWTVMSSPVCGRIPRACLAAALRSPALQASELQALRGLLRWAASTEPNVVWHTAQSVSRRGARRRDVSDASVRQTIADLIGLIRLEHIPPDNDVLQQAIRRGVIPHPPAGMLEGARGSDAWLTQRPPRAFLPYIDEIKALLDNQSLPEADLFRARRARCLHRIPDTLYMVAAERGSSAPTVPEAPISAESRCVPPAVQRALRLRQRELRASPPAAAAATLPLIDRHELYRQIALRCVREMALPDSCADLLLNDKDEQQDREGSWSESEDAPPARDASRRDYCCRSAVGGGGGSQGSLRSVSSDQHSNTGRSSHSSPPQSRRDYPAAGSGGHAAGSHAGGGHVTGSHAAGREGAVPDVALPPNGNTHLLAQHSHSYGGMGVGVLQLDLGDGATHTPRPGSRALRAATQHSRNYRDQLTLGRNRVLTDDEELRTAAMELSIMRAYSSYGGVVAVTSSTNRSYTLTHRHAVLHAGPLRRLSPSPVAVQPLRNRPQPLALQQEQIDLRNADVCVGADGSPAQSRARQYRLEPPSYGGSGHSSRGPSPNNYA